MNKNKFNWGTGISSYYNHLYGLLQLATVVYLMNQDVDLVASDYYNKGIHHQEQIDRMNRTNKMGDEVSISPENGFIRLVLPKSFATKKFNGNNSILSSIKF